MFNRQVKIGMTSTCEIDNMCKMKFIT